MLEASPGERLRTLRELLGWTQTDLAKATGLLQSWISEVERSHREPTRDELQVVANATNTPIKFFYVQTPSIPLDSLRFRKMASASKQAERRVHAFYSESYRATEDMMTALEFPPPPLPYATKAELGQDEIEDLAKETREALRLDPQKPVPHVTRALERGGVAVAPIVFQELISDSDARPTGHYGVSYWGGVGAPALVGYFPGKNGDRDRLTLAHELGHLVLHTFRPKASDAEREAFKFAGAFLMPRERAEEELSERLLLTDYARLKAKWGMSIQALIMRGRSLGIIGDSRYRSLFVQLSQKGWRKNEPVAVGSEDPQLLWKLLTRRYGPRPYVEASEDLAIPAAVLRSIAPAPRPTSVVDTSSAAVVDLADRSQVRQLLGKGRRQNGVSRGRVMPL